MEMMLNKQIETKNKEKLGFERIVVSSEEDLILRNEYFPDFIKINMMTNK